MCKNKVSQWVPSGWDYKEVIMECGDTGIHGQRLTCDECLANEERMAEIKRHQANADADNAWLRSAEWGEM